MSASFDEQAAADALDVAIDDALAGDRADPALAWLSDAFTTAPPLAVTERVAGQLKQASESDAGLDSRREAGQFDADRRARAGASGNRGAGKAPGAGKTGRDLWRWPRVAAALLGTLLMIQGAGNLVSGRWIADNIGEPFSPHAMTEGGFALIAIGFVALIASLDRQWVVLAVAAVVPLGIMLGAHGVREINVFAWGAVLHLTEGALAVILLVSFVVAWRSRRRR